MYTVDHLRKKHQDEARRMRRSSASIWRRRRREHKQMLNAFHRRKAGFAIPRYSTGVPAVRKLFSAMAAAVVAGLVVLVG
jgi:hypothetical protein